MSVAVCDRRTHNIAMDLVKAQKRGLLPADVEITHFNCRSGPATLRATFGDEYRQLEIVYPRSAIDIPLIYCETTIVDNSGEPLSAPALGYGLSKSMSNLYELASEITRLVDSWKRHTV